MTFALIVASPVIVAKPKPRSLPCRTPRSRCRCAPPSGPNSGNGVAPPRPDDAEHHDCGDRQRRRQTLEPFRHRFPPRDFGPSLARLVRKCSADRRLLSRNRLGEPRCGVGDLRRLDPVGVVQFVVLDVHAALLEQVPSPVREADLHDRVAAPVGDEDSRRRGSSGCQPSTTGTKPEKARIPAGAGRSGPSPSA